MKKKEQQTRPVKNYKTFLKSSNFLRKFNALFYISQFQLSIKLRTSWLNIVKLNKAINFTKLLRCLLSFLAVNLKY